MSKVIDTSQWIVFFTKAGLPPNVAANYALIFFDNRIQLDMLLDLSKEYLYDMGIKIMGDVIAILRYAKEFHTQLSKERMFGSTNAAVTGNKAIAERIVGHYARRFSPVQTPPAAVNTNFTRTHPPKSNIISLKRKPSEVKEVKRIRRVKPEEEGAYKIKMPSGTTERTRQILQQQKQLIQGSKRSVFSRLGDSAVSSSTDTKKVSITPHQPSSSVFERLGPNKVSSDDLPTSTVFNDVDKSKKFGSALPYKGVLKMTVAKNRTVVSTSQTKSKTAFPRNVLGITRSRTVIRPKQDKFQNITKTIKVNQINSILTATKPSALSAKLLRTTKDDRSQGIFGRTVSHRLGVKNRLGNKVTEQNMKSTSSVFDRLGV